MLATFVVTESFDEVVTSESPAVLSSGGDSGTLRQAIFDADFLQGPDIITFDPSLAGQTITLGRDENGDPIDFGLASGQLLITEGVEINGLGWNMLTIDASAMQATSAIGDGERAFEVNLNTATAENVTIRDLAITGGDAGEGGAIFANLEDASTLTLERAGATAGLPSSALPLRLQ